MNHKYSLFLILAALWLFSSVVVPSLAVDETEYTPWVYPRNVVTIPAATYIYTTWIVPLHGGYNKINLTLWNHDQNKNFTRGRFVIAIKSGNNTFTINNVNLAFEAQDLTGTSTPGKPFPPEGIFPCPWKQYLVGTNLTKRESNNGWLGPGDKSGMEVIVEITVPYPNSVQNILLYFMAWGYENNGTTNNDIVDTPKGRATSTVAVPPLVIPVSPYGVFAATTAMVLGMAIFGAAKRKSPFRTIGN